LCLVNSNTIAYICNVIRNGLIISSKLTSKDKKICAMEVQDLSKRQFRPGQSAKKQRREEILSYVKILHGNRHWRSEFCKDNPDFDNADGLRLLYAASRGRCDAPELLEALRVWIPKIQAEQPEWFVKQLAIDVP